MQKFLTLMIFFAIAKSAIAQSNFSFNCRKDTLIECTTTCLTLKTTVPNIYSSTTSYTVNKSSTLSCFRPYVNPAAAGTLANLLIDDRYSPVIDIGFPFSFYGNTYTKLIASTNGFLSFDTAKSLANSHFGILNNGTTNLSSTSGVPQDLPSSLYDRAIIMGPYHDLDPNTSAFVQQIKYDVVGTAPYRKWILSFYNVPLYTTACLNLNGNTHQIVLYETLGIVEVFIFDKEICLNWNNGRAIIGMQDFNKSSSIMAPSRQASSGPWGSMSMNESWQFVPAAGQSLFNKVELYTLSGNFVATGRTASLPNNLLDVSFDNICPPSAGETYLVKSSYKDPANLSSEIISIDTINISRGDPITYNLIPAICVQNSSGQVTILTPVGSSYEYSIDGNNWQTSTVFNLPPGSYTLRSRMIGSSCISTKKIDLVTETFEASIKIIRKPCPPPLTASIEIFPKHGIAPYLYKLDTTEFQSSNTFTGLVEGNYPVVVMDSRGCIYSTVVTIISENLAFASVTNSICGKAPSGSITVTPNYGFAPYSFALDGGTFQSSDTFIDLAPGVYNITIQDSILCNYSFSVTVGADVNMFANPEIIKPACYGNSNGKIILHASEGVAPYLYSLDSGEFQTNNTFTNLAAGNYVIKIKDASGCILDTTITMLQPNPVGGSAVIIPAANCHSKDGEITVKANGGNVPYMYSINNGTTYQASNIFYIEPGVFNITIKDSTGCSATISDTVFSYDNKLRIDLGPDKTICSGSSAIISVTNSQQFDIYNLDPLAGPNIIPSKSFTATPSDTTTYIILAKTAVCQGTDTITVNVLQKPIADAGRDTVICNNTYALLEGNATNVSGSVNYLWLSSNDLMTPASKVTMARPKSSGSTRYRLEVSDNYGCNFKSYDYVTVTMLPPFIPFAGKDTVASIGVPHQLMATGGKEYFWSPSSVLNDATIPNPTTILQNDIKFNVVVKDSIGCVGTSSVLVKVYKGQTYYIPNAFTPNGDGLNDVFKPIAPGIKQTNYFRIFNRWGKLMFESKNANTGWDGKYLGMLQPPAVYVWVIKGIDSSNKPIELKGIVTLIR